MLQLLSAVVLVVVEVVVVVVLLVLVVVAVVVVVVSCDLFMFTFFLSADSDRSVLLACGHRDRTVLFFARAEHKRQSYPQKSYRPI